MKRLVVAGLLGASRHTTVEPVTGWVPGGPQ